MSFKFVQTFMFFFWFFFGFTALKAAKSFEI